MKRYTLVLREKKHNRMIYGSYIVAENKKAAYSIFWNELLEITTDAAKHQEKYHVICNEIQQ